MKKPATHTSKQFTMLSSISCSLPRSSRNKAALPLSSTSCLKFRSLNHEALITAGVCQKLLRTLKKLHLSSPDSCNFTKYVKYQAWMHAYQITRWSGTCQISLTLWYQTISNVSLRGKELEIAPPGQLSPGSAGMLSSSSFLFPLFILCKCTKITMRMKMIIV